MIFSNKEHLKILDIDNWVLDPVQTTPKELQRALQHYKIRLKRFEKYHVFLIKMYSRSLHQTPYGATKGHP